MTSADEFLDTHPADSFLDSSPAESFLDEPEKVVTPQSSSLIFLDSARKVWAPNPNVVGVAGGNLPQPTPAAREILSSPYRLASEPFNEAGKILNAGVSDAGATIGATLAGRPDLIGSQGGNLLELATRDEPIYDPKPLPQQRTLAAISKSNPIAATAGKIAGGIVQSAPMLAAMPAGALGKLVAAGFTADMIASIPGAGKSLGEEMGKNPEDRDYDKITTALSEIAQGATFGGLGVSHLGAKPIGKLAEQLKREPIESPPSEIQPQDNTQLAGEFAKTHPGAVPLAENETTVKATVGNARFTKVDGVWRRQPNILSSYELEPIIDPDVVQVLEQKAYENKQKESNANQIESPVGDVRSEIPATSPQVAEGKPGEIQQPAGTQEAVQAPQEKVANAPDEIAQKVAKDTGFTLVKQEQAGATQIPTPEQMASYPEHVQNGLKEFYAKNKPEWEFTDNRPGSVTPGRTFRAPIDATESQILEIYKKVAPEYSNLGPEIGAAGLGGESAPAGTALKNAVGELERASHGLPEQYPTQRRNMAASWLESGDILRKDPLAGKKLADELKHNPERGMTDVDSALLLRHKVELENAKNQAAEDTITATTPEAKAEADARFESMSSQLLDLLDAAKFRGSQWGREGRWRQALAFEDYSLETMTSNRQVELGRKLNDAEKAEVKVLHDKINATQKAFDDYVAKTEAEKSGKEANEAIDAIKKKKTVKNPFKSRDVSEEVAATTKTIGERIAGNEKNSISSMVQKLARLFVEQGVRDRDLLIDKVHNVLQDLDPNFTRRETMDAISGYGEFKQLSKDEISRKLRDLKGQMQQVAKLEDMQSGKPPLKTGVERRIPSAEESRLITLVNEAKNEFQIPIDDPNTQLKSSLDELKARLTHATDRYKGMLERGEFEKKPKRLLQRDTEANRLHFAAENAKRDWHESMMQDRLAKQSIPRKILRYGSEVLNTSRALLTSMDLSAVLRQGGFIAFGHPIRALKSFPAMFRAFASKEAQHRINQEIVARDNYPLYQSAKLYLSNHGQKLSQMEEAYMSRWAEKIPLVAGSERAYTTFLNKLRADSFDAMAASLSRGKELTPAEANAIANFVNVATGRGNLGMKENALVGLNTIFFAPRYAASRFQILAGQPLYRGSARTRIAVAKEYARFLVGIGMVYALAQADGAKIEDDPRSSDFGKLRYGNTRIDPAAGLIQATTLLSRIGSGSTKNSKGHIIPIRGPKVPYGGSTSPEVFGRFLRSKLSPVIGTGFNIAAGKDVVGQPVTPKSIAQGLLVPLSMQDIYDTMLEQGVPRGTAMALLSTFGMGLQNYNDRKSVKVFNAAGDSSTPSE